MSNEENPNLIKVIRLSDGLIMDFKLLMKHPNIPNQRYWGTTPVGQIDQEYIKQRQKQFTINTLPKVDIVS